MTLDQLLLALGNLRTLPPIERAERARTLIDDAKAALSLERALAIAEARAISTGADIARQLGVTPQAVAKADRVLLRRALEILLSDGATSASEQQLMQGLREELAIEHVARRVVHGARNAVPGALDNDQHAVIERARQRAEAIIG